MVRSLNYTIMIAPVSRPLRLQTFLDTIYRQCRLGIDESSIYQMRIAVRLLERWRNQTLTTHDLTPQLLRAFLADYAASGRAAATVNGKRRFLLALWKCACDEGHCQPDCRQSDLGRVPRMSEPFRVPEAWHPDEFSRIIAQSRAEAGMVGELPANRWWPSLLLAEYYSGERIGAMLAIPMENVLISDRGMIVPAECRKNNRERWCALGDSAIAAIAAILEPQRHLMWPWPMSREWLETRFKRILKRAGVRYGRKRGGLFNKIRRTSGSLIDAAGGDGSRHIGNGRAVFERHYRDPRIADRSQANLLPDVE